MARSEVGAAGATAAATAAAAAAAPKPRVRRTKPNIVKVDGPEAVEPEAQPLPLEVVPILTEAQVDEVIRRREPEAPEAEPEAEPAAVRCPGCGYTYGYTYSSVEADTVLSKCVDCLKRPIR